MKLKVFTVYDSAARAYIPPFFMAETAQAQRTFGDCASTPDHAFCKYPNDFCLYEVGEFDDATGVLIPYKEHTNLGLAASYQVKIPASDLFHLEGSN